MRELLFCYHSWDARISIPQHSLLIYLQMKVLTGDEDQLVARTVCNVLLIISFIPKRPAH